MNGGGGNCGEVFFVGLRAAGVFAGVDVDVSEAGEDDAVGAVDIAVAGDGADRFDEAGIGVDLDGGFKLAIVVGDSSFNAQQ